MLAKDLVTFEGLAGGELETKTSYITTQNDLTTERLSNSIPRDRASEFILNISALAVGRCKIRPDRYISGALLS